MARHHAFWVILSGAVPTAFRSPRREDLLPTLHQLQRTQQDVALKWFDRGQLWESPEAARLALIERRRESSGRNADWRPGGAHKDPRARYQLTRDQKRARFKQRQRRDFDAKSGPTPGAPEQPGGPPPFQRDRQHDRWRKPQGHRPFRPQGDRPYGDRPYKPKGPGRPAGQFDRPPSGRPPGHFDRPPSSRPPGKFGRPPGKFGRPPGQFDRPPGGRPPAGGFGKPGGKSGRPPGERPPGKFGNSRPPGKFGRPPGKFGSGRPPGKFGGGRPPGKFGSGRPPGKFRGGPGGRGPKK